MVGGFRIYEAIKLVMAEKVEWQTDPEDFEDSEAERGFQIVRSRAYPLCVRGVCVCVCVCVCERERERERERAVSTR